MAAAYSSARVNPARNSWHAPGMQAVPNSLSLALGPVGVLIRTWWTPASRSSCPHRQGGRWYGWECSIARNPAAAAPARLSSSAARCTASSGSTEAEGLAHGTVGFVVVLDASIVNIALPSIGRGLHFSLANLSWVVNAYVLTFGGFLLLGGRIAELLGRRRIFTVGLVVFSLASLAGGLAQNQAWLIAARAIQGLGAALLASAALSLVTATFREGSERNKNSPTGMRVALVSLLMVGCLLLLLCV